MGNSQQRALISKNYNVLCLPTYYYSPSNTPSNNTVLPRITTPFLNISVSQSVSLTQTPYSGPRLCPQPQQHPFLFFRARNGFMNSPIKAEQWEGHPGHSWHAPIRTEQRWKWTEKWVNKTRLYWRCFVLAISVLKESWEPPMLMVDPLCDERGNTFSLIGMRTQCSHVFTGTLSLLQTVQE